MIPKIIHYCWFGKKEKPKSVKKLINKWQTLMPEYLIMEWNEDNFDVGKYTFTEEAYSCRKFAFVADFVRLYALYEHGGIYLDTDVEVLKKFDQFLHQKVFLGFEGDKQIGTATIGSQKGDIFIGRFLQHYLDNKFKISNTQYNDTPNTHILGNILRDNGLVFNNSLQTINDSITVYPLDYFSARSFTTGEVLMTNSTICIHHFASSWLPWHVRQRIKVSYALKSFKRRVFRSNR